MTALRNGSSRSRAARSEAPLEDGGACVYGSRFELAGELIATIQHLSLARSLLEVQEIVKTAARSLTGADGATFVLRDATHCYYADEDAISPLWKGQRFPLDACISGWAMCNRQPAVIEDIYADQRIPHDAYRPTFVKSLAMVPIRTLDPVGAIGNYWARPHRPTPEEVEVLQALADSTAVAMENVRVYEQLERRVADRTAELRARTEELECTSRSVRSLYEQATRSFDALSERNEHHLHVLHTLAHEVRSQLGAGVGLLRLALEDSPAVDQRLRTDLDNVDAIVSEAVEIVNRQLEAERLEVGAVQLRVELIDLAGELSGLRAMRALGASANVRFVIEEPDPGLVLCTDRTLLGHILRNLVVNALKFTDAGEVRVSAERDSDGGVRLAVADTGIGIAPEHVDRLFEKWHQVDSAQSHRPRGSGLGLPLVRRLVDALGGRIDVQSTLGRGSTFSVTLPPAVAQPEPNLAPAH
ncbi:MAG: ATP-binding protein [Solirubrobacteraceae bacterium]